MLPSPITGGERADARVTHHAWPVWAGSLVYHESYRHGNMLALIPLGIKILAGVFIIGVAALFILIFSWLIDGYNAEDEERRECERRD